MFNMSCVNLNMFPIKPASFRPRALYIDMTDYGLVSISYSNFGRVSEFVSNITFVNTTNVCHIVSRFFFI